MTSDVNREGQRSAPAQDLDREQIVWAYRVLLDRDPEGEKTIRDAYTYGSMRRLRSAILFSEEFRGRDASLRVPLTSPPLTIESHADPVAAAALLARVAAVWDALGEERPHWSVLSAARFSPEHIAETEPGFFATGAADAAMLLATLARVGVDTARLGLIFEFGCGIGRVTPHLAWRFRRVEACDVSPSHIRLAEATIKAANIDNVTIHRASLPDFGMTRPFDLWFSRIVLQHNPPPVMKQILERALDLLKPGGVAVFQVPTYAAGYRFSTSEYLQKPETSAQIEMHVLPQSEVFAVAQKARCTPLEIMEDDSVGIEGWISSVFVLRKDGNQS